MNSNKKRKNRYHKTLHTQAYERLVSMQRFGESKKVAKKDGTEKDKIFSRSTYETYWKHIKYFLKWLKTNYPKCTTLKAAKRHVNEWLQERVDQVDDNGRHLSAWTIQTEEAALNKLFGIDKNDRKRFQAPKRQRVDIKRSRGPAKQDKDFSIQNNWELIQFCRGTGCRRNVLEKLEGRDLWTQERMIREAERLSQRLHAGDRLSDSELKHLAVLNDALITWTRAGKQKEIEKIESRVFDGAVLSEEEMKRLDDLRAAMDTEPDHKYFIHHRQDKGGKYRYSPVIGAALPVIVERMSNTDPYKRVWKNVNSHADVHGYRADYAGAIYNMYARDIDDIPYDKYHTGINRWYQSEVYTCRKDEPGKKLDKKAMMKASKALGHGRYDVVGIFYLRNL